MQNTRRKTPAIILFAIIAVLMFTVGAVVVSSPKSNASAQTMGEEDSYNFTLTTDEAGNDSYKVAVKPTMRTSLKVAVIPDTYNDLPVTEIASSGFFSCTALERVVLPQSVHKIGMNGFANCSKLMRIMMPNVKDIGNNAFGMCTSLNKLFIPYTVQTMGANIVRNNANTVYVQKSLNEVSTQWSSSWNSYHTGEVLYDADPTAVLDYRELLDDTGSVIGYELAEYQNLPAPDQDVIIYDSFRPTEADPYLPVYNVCSEAFTFSYANSITIRARHEDDPSAPAFNHKMNFRSNAFLAACVIEEIAIEVDATFDHPANLSVGPTESMFDGMPIVGDENGKSVKLFESATAISIVLPANMEFVPDRAFCYNDGLKNIKVAGQAYDGKNILPAVTEIGNNAFDSCIGLSNVYIPSTVTKMGEAVFNDWGFANAAQQIHIDLYEPAVPSGWNANWNSGIRRSVSVNFKPLIEVPIDLQDGTGNTVTIGVWPGGPMPAIDIPECFGYIFKGVFSQPNGKGLQYYTETAQSARAWDGASPLYAHWEAKTSSVTLDDGTSAQTVTAVFGQPMPAANKPKRRGYIFNGFYAIEQDGTHTYYYNANMGSQRNWDKAESPTTLHADWILEVYKITYLNVKEEENPNRNIKTYTVESPEIVFQPAIRQGYICKWIPQRIEAGSTGDVTIVANWSLEIYKINYILEDGMTNPSSNPTEYTIESPTITFADPEKPGYRCWWEIANIPAGSTGNKEIYGRSAIKDFKIKYVLNGGSDPQNPSKIDITETVTLKPSTQREYWFKGWKLVDTGEIVSTLSGIDRDIVLEAQWDLVEYKPAVTDTALTITEPVAIVRLPNADFNTRLHIIVGSGVEKLTIYGGTPTYTMYIEILERTEDIDLHFNDLRFEAPNNQAGIRMAGKATLNLYTVNACLINGGDGERGANGRSAIYSRPSEAGKNGADGHAAIECYMLIVHTSNVVLTGGDGGAGGRGGNGIYNPNEVSVYGSNFGANGGNGGNGAPAVSVSSASFLGNYITLRGGRAGKGGDGGNGISTRAGQTGLGGSGGSAGNYAYAVNGTYSAEGRYFNTYVGLSASSGKNGVTLAY